MLELLNRRVLGLDIGSYAIKAVEFLQTWNGFEVVQLRSLRLSPKAEETPVLLQSFLTTHGLPTGHVVTAVAGDRISMHRLSFPFRGRREIAQAVPFAVEERVPFDLEDICVDWVAVASEKERTEVIAALAPRAEVARNLEMLQQAGVDPRTLEAEGLLLGNLGKLVDLSGTRLLLDIGHRKSTLCLCVEGRPIAARTVPIAGRALTEAIARDRNLSIADAERLKCEEGLFKHGLDSEFRAATAVLDRLARELLRTLGSLEPLTRDPAEGRLEEILLCGGTAHLHRLSEYLAERTGIPTTRLRFRPDTAGGALLAGGDPLHFACGIALALRGVGATHTHINFRKQEFSYRRDISEILAQLRPTAWLTAAVLVLAALDVGSRIAIESRRAQQLTQRAAQYYNQVFPNSPAPENLATAMRDAVRTARERADFLGVYGGNLSALDLLTEISRLVPKDLEVVFEELSIDNQVVRIRGHTKSFEAVDRLESELSKFSPFSKIRRGEVQSDPRRGGKIFSLTIHLAEEEQA